MTAPNLQTNDPVASRQLLEISQYTYDIRYKPGKLNLTADMLSRPIGTPVGDAYRPSVTDAVAAVSHRTPPPSKSEPWKKQWQKLPRLKYAKNKQSQMS